MFALKKTHKGKRPPSFSDALRLDTGFPAVASVIGDGNIVAVDYSQTDPDDLSGKIVVACHREHALSFHRFLFVQGVQMLDVENRDFPPIVSEKDRNWRTIGSTVVDSQSSMIWTSYMNPSVLRESEALL